MSEDEAKRVRIEPSEEEVKARVRSRLDVLSSIAKKYPALADKLKRMAEETGTPIDELIASYLNWAIEVREFSTYVTEADLKKVTPEALTSALKLMMFMEQQYFKVLAYANLAQGIQLYNIIASAMRGIAPAEAGIQLPPPSPSTVEKVVNSIMRAIELFTLGRPEVRQELAKEVARELLKLSQQPTTQTST